MSVPEVILLIDSRGFGGVETHVTGLARALLARGWSARVVMFREWGGCPLAARCRGTGVPLTILDGSLGKLLAFLRAFPPALLHTHGYKAGILGRLCARWTGVPAVSTYHSGDKGRGRVRFYTFLDRITAGLGTAIAVSDEIAGGLPVAATIVESFVDLPRHEARGDGGAIAFVGRLDHEKGPDIFCRLARRFAVVGGNDGLRRAANFGAMAVALAILAAVAVAVAGPTLVRLVAQPAYHGATALVPLLAGLAATRSPFRPSEPPVRSSPPPWRCPCGSCRPAISVTKPCRFPTRGDACSSWR